MGDQTPLTVTRVSVSRPLTVQLYVCPLSSPPDTPNLPPLPRRFREDKSEGGLQGLRGDVRGSGTLVQTSLDLLPPGTIPFPPSPTSFRDFPFPCRPQCQFSHVSNSQSSRVEAQEDLREGTRPTCVGGPLGTSEYDKKFIPST